MNNNRNIFLEKLKLSLNNLPGEKAHNELKPLNRPYFNKPKSIKNSAILLLLHEKEEGISIPMIKRSVYNGSHSGQISFPGGKQEKSDSSIAHTALREASEEIGLRPNDLEVIGELTPLYIPISGFWVYVILAYTDKQINYIADTREVDEIFHIPIDFIKQDDIISIHEVVNSDVIKFSAPAFIFEDKIIWGASAMILNELRTIIKHIK